MSQADGRLRRSLLAAIHVRAKALGLDEDTRRDVQRRVSGKASCRDMTLPELRAVADELRQTERRVKPGPIDATRPIERTDGMRRRARALAAELGAGDRYLDAIAQRQAGVSFAAASAHQLRGVIAAVWRQAQRRRKQAHAVG